LALKSAGFALEHDAAMAHDVRKSLLGPGHCALIIARPRTQIGTIQG